MLLIANQHRTKNPEMPYFKRLLDLLDVNDVIIEFVAVTRQRNRIIGYLLYSYSPSYDYHVHLSAYCIFFFTHCICYFF